MTGESKTEAIRRALLDRRERLQSPARQRTEGVQEWLEQSVWPATKAEFRGKPVSQEEMDALWE
jgi:antitoxin VapB